MVLQGHIGSVWENGEYLRTRDLEKVKVSFEDQLTRLKTDYLDIGMIHYVDGHCAPCAVGINIAEVNKYLNLSLAQGSVPETVADHYKLL